jgi:hypothetical protein
MQPTTAKKKVVKKKEDFLKKLQDKRERIAIELDELDSAISQLQLNPSILKSLDKL